MHPSLQEPVNVALNKNVNDSSRDQTGPASHVNDGNDRTRWSSAYLEHSWITIDLG